MSLNSYWDGRDGEYVHGLLLPLTMLSSPEIEVLIRELGIIDAGNFRRSINALRVERPEVQFLRSALRNAAAATAAAAASLGVSDAGTLDSAPGVLARAATVLGVDPDKSLPAQFGDQVITITGGLLGGAVLDHITRRALARRSVHLTRGRGRALSAVAGLLGIGAAEALDE